MTGLTLLKFVETTHVKLQAMHELDFYSPEQMVFDRTFLLSGITYHVFSNETSLCLLVFDPNYPRPELVSDLDYPMEKGRNNEIY